MNQKIKDEIIRVIEVAATNVGAPQWDNTSTDNQSWDLWEKIEVLTELNNLILLVGSEDD